MNALRTDAADPAIVCRNLVRIFREFSIEVQALQGLNLTVDRRRLVAIVGESGSGKSTLLSLLPGLASPPAGEPAVGGHSRRAVPRRVRLAYRRRVVGFVWQQTARNLVPYLTARENVELPMRLARGPRRRPAPPAA